MCHGVKRPDVIAAELPLVILSVFSRLVIADPLVRLSAWRPRLHDSEVRRAQGRPSLGSGPSREGRR